MRLESLRRSARLVSLDGLREPEDPLRIATMHRVKGLEFDRVVLAGMSDKNVPERYAVERSDDNYWFGPDLPFLRTGPGVALDGKPQFDLSQFDPNYFDRLRSRVLQARDRGIYVSVMLFNGWSVSFPKGGFSGISWQFYAGILLAACGGMLVMLYKPAPAAAAPPAAVEPASSQGAGGD